MSPRVRVPVWHFRDEDDLLDAVVERVYGVARAHLGPQVGAAADPAVALRTFVEGSVEFHAAHPDHMAALSAIFAAGATAAPSSPTSSGRRRTPTSTG